MGGKSIFRHSDSRIVEGIASANLDLRFPSVDTGQLVFFDPHRLSFQSHFYNAVDQLSSREITNDSLEEGSLQQRRNIAEQSLLPLRPR